MTFLTATFEHLCAQENQVPLPEPRSPEEVISLLTTEPPIGEHSVDAL